MMKIKHCLILALFSASLMTHADTVSTPTVEGFVVKDGLFLSGDLGIFSAFGSFGPKSMSEVNTMIALTIGYDFSRNFGIGLKLANGSVANASLNSANPETPNHFGLYLVDVNGMGAVSLTPRLRFVANLFGGMTVMVPEVAPGASPLGANAGVSIGILYDTLMADMVVGLNLAGYGFFTFNSPAGSTGTYFGASITPVLKYVF